jgi:hypothetical protein
MSPVPGVGEAVTVTLPVNPFVAPPRLVKVTTSVADPPVEKLTVVEAGEIEKPFTLIRSKAPVFAARVPAAILGSHCRVEPGARAVVTLTSLVTVPPGGNVKGAG